MAIYDILKEVKDKRSTEDAICQFNGFLEDYLSILETNEDKQNEYKVLSSILEMDNNLRIVVDLQLNIHKKAIANQIIRYKDAFKLPQGAIVCPYIIYGMFKEEQKAIVYVYGDKQEYILAKALYYVISEPENEYEGTRNEIVAISMDTASLSERLETIRTFILDDKKAGIVQRNLDCLVFENYEAMYQLAQTMAVTQKDNAKDILKDAKSYEACIYQMIVKWFLLKKFSYVQYMMDKTTLQKEHDGNVKKQRQVAKEKSDAICFVSFTELWKLTRNL